MHPRGIQDTRKIARKIEMPVQDREALPFSITINDLKCEIDWK